MKISEDETVERLRNKTGIKLSAKERQLYKQWINDYIEEGTDPDINPNFFENWAAYVQEARDTYAPSADDEDRGESPRFSTAGQAVAVNTLSAYQKALSHVIALEASKDPDVQYFRSHLLGNKLLTSAEDVEMWILRQSEAEGGRVSVSESGGVVIYTAPNHCDRCVFTRLSGVLFQLSELNLRLEDRYHWNPAEATSFVLVVGFCPSVAILWSGIRGSYPNSCPRAMRRIELLIDPILSPEEVAEAYSHIRKSVIPRKRIRPLSEKFLCLAEFAATHPQGRGLGERMAEWNRLSEQHKWGYKPYAEERNFSRDCGLALRGLLNPDYATRDSE